MKATAWAEQFLGRFVLPLCRGGAVQVGEPLLRRGADQLLTAAAAGLDDTPTGTALAAARQRQLRALVPQAGAPRLAADPSALLLVVALHDLLFLHHPAAARLSERQTAQLQALVLRLADKARAGLPTAAVALPISAASTEALTRIASSVEPSLPPLATARLLGRYSLLAGLGSLGHPDPAALPPPASPLRALLGRAPAPPPASPRISALGELEARPSSALALRALLLASPLSALLPPAGSALAADLGAHAAWLRLPVIARLVVARYLARGAIAALSEAGAAAVALLVPPPKATLDAAPPPADLMTVLCLVSHLHVCAALAGGALPSADTGAASRDSYALYAALAAHFPVLAAPRDAVADPLAGQRLLDYVRACRAAAAPGRVRELAERCHAALTTPTPTPALRPADAGPKDSR
jgi:hypothetical protein